MNQISIYSSLPYWLQNVVVSLHGYKLSQQRFGYQFQQIMKFLDSTDGWDKERILSYKEENIAKIIEHAYKHCPYYHKKYAKEGLSYADFKGLSDLQKFPILTKEEIRHNFPGMIADNIPSKDLISFHTSGSTGKALKFYLTKYSTAFYWAVDQRYKNRFGFGLGKECINFSARPVVPISSFRPPYWRHDRILHRYFINMQQLTADKIVPIVDFLNSKGIEIFIGYPSIMTAFANELGNANIVLEAMPKHIFTGAEKLYDNQKSILQAAFNNVEIHELYSFSEQAAIATHCKHSRYHEDFEIGHIELLHPLSVNDGLQGEILATGFTNLGMPFIRYQNGDTAVFSNRVCDCGLHSQVISDIVGRNEDYIITPEGAHIQRFASVLKNVMEIKECQVIQYELGEICLKIVRRENYSIASETKLIQNIQQWISPTIKVRFEYVNEIPRTNNGKFRAVISMLNKKDKS